MGPLPNGRTSWLMNGDDPWGLNPNYLRPSWDDPTYVVYHPLEFICLLRRRVKLHRLQDHGADWLKLLKPGRESGPLLKQHVAMKKTLVIFLYIWGLY